MLTPPPASSFQLTTRGAAASSRMPAALSPASAASWPAASAVTGGAGSGAGCASSACAAAAAAAASRSAFLRLRQLDAGFGLLSEVRLVGQQLALLGARGLRGLAIFSGPRLGRWRLHRGWRGWRGWRVRSDGPTRSVTCAVGGEIGKTRVYPGFCHIFAGLPGYTRKFFGFEYI